MMFKNFVRYGLVAICLIGNTICTENKYNDESNTQKIVFQSPTINEIHCFVKNYKQSNPCAIYTFQDPLPLTTKNGLNFEIQIYLWDSNRNLIQRALNLTKYDETCCIEKDGLMKKIIFRYSPNSGTELTIEADLATKSISSEDFYPKNVSPTYESYSVDDTKYITFNDPNLVFTIHQ